MRRAIAALSLVSAVAAQPGGGQQVEKDGKVLQEMKIEAPGLDEEDQYGYNMPQKYMCNSCKAVVYHLNKEMGIKHPKKRDWKESELLDVYDDICAQDTFEGYGIKLLNGKNELGGPALAEEQEKLAPGQASIQMGGDSWKKRLAEECRKLVYEAYGEEEVYEDFKSKSLTPAWCVENSKARKRYHCEAAKTGGKKDKKKKEKKDKKKKEKKEKKDKKEKKKPAGVEKRISADTFIQQLAQKSGVSDTRNFMVAKTSEEWLKKLQPLFAGSKAPAGNDEL